MYGHVPDEEMELALPPDKLGKMIDGLKSLHKSGIRYPIPRFGLRVDFSLAIEEIK